jgi:hypothetical protein
MIEQDKKPPHFELTGNILIFNYLKVSQLPIGLLVNFRRGKLEWKRLQSNQECIVDMETVEEPVSF